MINALTIAIIIAINTVLINEVVAMIRTDIHRPSVIEPTDYEFVGFQYLRVDDLGSALFLQSERQRIQRHMDTTGGDYSRHEHGGNCAICGSANAIYKALFWHKPSNDYISTGLDCAEKLGCGETTSFRRNVASALEQKAGKRKAAALLEAANLSAAWALYEQGQKSATELPREETTLCDIVNRLVQYGSLSDAQMSFLRRLVDQIANRAIIQKQRQAEHDKAKAIPTFDKRATISGKVLSIKVPDYDRGDGGPVRMLVQHADGWKIWGSVPTCILDTLKVGNSVKFDATIKTSDRDEKFGFFSRPTKAEIVQ